MKYGPIAVLVVGLLALGVWFLWPDSRELDIPAVEQEIATGIEDQARTSNVTVNCPESIEWDTGGTFRCFASDNTGQVRVTVYMENDNGEMSWVVE